MADRPAPLSPSQVATLLRAAEATIRAELTALPEPLLRWHPAPDAWCVLEVVGHLSEAERRGFAGRIRTLLEQDAPALTPWDQAAVARARGDCARPRDVLLEEFSALRRASVTLVAGLHGAALGRGGSHPMVGHLTIADLLHEWAHHDRNHLRQMLANVQAAVWPHMGHAQRFSTP